MSFYYGNKKKITRVCQKIYCQTKGADKASVLGCEKAGRNDKRDV